LSAAAFSFARRASGAFLAQRRPRGGGGAVQTLQLARAAAESARMAPAPEKAARQPPVDSGSQTVGARQGEAAAAPVASRGVTSFFFCSPAHNNKLLPARRRGRSLGHPSRRATQAPGPAGPPSSVWPSERLSPAAGLAPVGLTARRRPFRWLLLLAFVIVAAAAVVVVAILERELEPRRPARIGLASLSLRALSTPFARPARRSARLAGRWPWPRAKPHKSASVKPHSKPRPLAGRPAAAGRDSGAGRDGAVA
jgi:hypothetical protein